MLPILFQFGSLTIYSFGFFLVIAYVVATFIFWREGRRQGYPEEKLLDLSLITLLGAFVGGRAFFVISHFEFFRGDLPSVFVFWEGGFSFYGASLGMLLAFYLMTRSWKWPFFQVADFAALSVLASYAIVKIGAFFAGIDYGVVTSLPWAVEFINVSGSRHPAQIYEAIFAILLFILMKIAYENNLKSNSFRSGKIFLLSAFFISLARFLLGFIRADMLLFYGLNLDQIVSLSVAIGALFLIYYLRFRGFREDKDNLLKAALSINSRALKRLKF